MKQDLEIEEKRKNRGRISDLFTNRIFFLNLAVISSAWFATGMMFYGLSIYMPEFKDTDIRLVTFFLGLAEIPADIVPIVALNRYEKYAVLCLHDIDCRLDLTIFINGDLLNRLPITYRFGRRYTSIFNYVMGGTVCIATGFIPIGYFSYEWPIVLLSLIGKFTSQVMW